MSNSTANANSTNSTAATIVNAVVKAAVTYTAGEQVGALALVIGLAAVAGLVFGSLGGFNIPKIGRFQGLTVPALFTKVTIPPIVAMIVIGCIVRNFFGTVVKPYNNVWAQWIRMFCLAVLLVRGGLQISFAGKGILVLLLSFVPLIFEATTQAVVALGLF